MMEEEIKKSLPDEGVLEEVLGDEVPDVEKSGEVDDPEVEEESLDESELDPFHDKWES